MLSIYFYFFCCYGRCAAAVHLLVTCCVGRIELTRLMMIGFFLFPYANYSRVTTYVSSLLIIAYVIGLRQLHVYNLSIGTCLTSRASMQYYRIPNM